MIRATTSTHCSSPYFGKKKNSNIHNELSFEEENKFLESASHFWTTPKVLTFAATIALGAAGITNWLTNKGIMPPIYGKKKPYWTFEKISVASHLVGTIMLHGPVRIIKSLCDEQKISEDDSIMFVTSSYVNVLARIVSFGSGIASLLFKR